MWYRANVVDKTKGNATPRRPGKNNGVRFFGLNSFHLQADGRHVVCYTEDAAKGIHSLSVSSCTAVTTGAVRVDAEFADVQQR